MCTQVNVWAEVWHILRTSQKENGKFPSQKKVEIFDAKVCLNLGKRSYQHHSVPWTRRVGGAVDTQAVECRSTVGSRRSGRPVTGGSELAATCLLITAARW